MFMAGRSSNPCAVFHLVCMHGYSVLGRVPMGIYGACMYGVGGTTGEPDNTNKI